MKRFLLACTVLCFPVVTSAARVTVEQAVPERSSSIPRGAQRVAMMHIKFAASCDDDVSINTLTLTHRGLGDVRDLSRVYVMEGLRRISRAQSISSRERTLDVRLSTFTIRKCTSRAITVMADLSAEAQIGSLHSLAILSSDDIQAGNADVEVAAVAALPANVTVPGQAATVSVEYANLNSPVTYGSNRTLARIRLTGDGEDQRITRIVLTNDGSARDADLQNLRLVTSRGEAVSPTIPQLDGDLAVFDLDPALSLDDNETKLIELKANVRASRARTIRFVIEEPSDIVAEIVRRR